MTVTASLEIDKRVSWFLKADTCKKLLTQMLGRCTISNHTFAERHMVLEITGPSEEEVQKAKTQLASCVVSVLAPSY